MVKAEHSYGVCSSSNHGGKARPYRGAFSIATLSVFSKYTLRNRGMLSTTATWCPKCKMEARDTIEDLLFLVYRLGVRL